MDNKARNILDSNFASLMLESMADGVFTLDEKGEDNLMESINGAYHGVHRQRGHRPGLYADEFQPLLFQELPYKY